MVSDGLCTLLHSAPDGCLLTDPAGQILEANLAAQSLLGVPDAVAIAGKPLAGFLAPGGAERFARVLADVAEHGAVGDLEAELRPFRGVPRRIWARAVLVPDGGGVLWMVRDVTQRAEAQAHREEAGRFREALMLAVAHDLRAPVSVIAGFVELLDNPAVTVPADTVADMVRELGPAIRGMKSVIDNLLDVDRTRPGVVGLRRAAAPIAPLVDRCLATAGLGERAVAEVGVSEADIDAGLAERILANLLVNADRYCPAGSKVAVRIRGVGGGIRIEVDDEGPGIPDGMKEEVFRRYQQLSPGGPGTGIGLYLVQRFAEFHGGRAWVEDRPGGGSSMRVYLPCDYS
ncbi:MAG TPA: ATP-binding protein [Actinomycetota bacterium]|nr:ATP-binding protein [Actinomycetota bacterium]